MATDEAGAVYVVGYTYGAFESNVSAGAFDMFVMQLCPREPATE